MTLTKRQQHAFLAIALGVLIYLFVPAVNGLTEQGVKLLSIFIPMVLIWLIDGGSGWSALLGATMLVFLKAYGGAETYQLFWGGSMVAMIIPFYMLANALEESGALMWLVRWILSRKIVHGHPKLFTVLFAISIVLISFLISAMVTVVLFFKALKDIAKSIKINRDSDFYRAHGLLIAWIGQVCDGTLVWARPYVAAMFAVIIGLGFTNFTLGHYFMLSSLYLAFIVLIGVLIVFFWIRPDSSAFMEFDDAALRKQLEENPMTKRAKILLVGMIIVILMYVLAFISPVQSVQAYFAGLPLAAPISLITALLCLVNVDGEPVLDLKQEAARLPWETVMFLGSVMLFGGIMGAEQFGISSFMSNLISPIVAGLPKIVTILLGLTLATVLTNLTSNAVANIVILTCFTPAMLSVGTFTASEVLAFAVCVTIVCSTAIATLAACATMSVVFCDDGIEYKGTAKYAIAVCAAAVLFCAFVLIPLGGILYTGIV